MHEVQMMGALCAQLYSKHRYLRYVRGGTQDQRMQQQGENILCVVQIEHARKLG